MEQNPSNTLEELRFPASERFEGREGPPGKNFDWDKEGLLSERDQWLPDPSVNSFLAFDGITEADGTKRAAGFYKRPGTATGWSDPIPFEGEKGRPGRDSFEEWKARENLPNATYEDYKEAFRGRIGEATQGDPGDDAFAVWRAREGRPEATYEEFKEDLRGLRGLSAYEVWAARPENAGKSEAAFLEELGGLPGQDAYEVWAARPENAGKTQEQFFESLKVKGDPGLDSFAEWKARENRPNATYGEYTDAFRGRDGNSFQPHMSGPLAGRAEWDLQAPPFGYLATDQDPHLLYWRGQEPGVWSAGRPLGEKGPSGLNSFDEWRVRENLPNATYEEYQAAFRGAAGAGVPAGGKRAEILKKRTDSDRDTAWFQAPDVFVEDFVHLVTTKPSVDVNTWDWTPAIAGAVAEAMFRVWLKTNIGPDVYRKVGAPTLVFGPHKYINRGRHSLRFTRGMTIRGSGRGTSHIEHQVGNVLFDINRSMQLKLSGITIQNRDPSVPDPPPGQTGVKKADGTFEPPPPAGTSFVKGLMENSVAFLVHERREDNLDGTLAPAGTTGTGGPGGNTLQITLDDIEINEFHKSFALEGNQQLDDIKWFGYRSRDNFIDFSYWNSQAVNQQFFGGEIVKFANYGYPLYVDQAHYNNRLATWSNPKTSWDGAIWDITAGGQIGVFGMSFIPACTTVLMQELGPNQADPTHPSFVGTNVARMPINFYNCRWELRRNDPSPLALSGVSVHRSTVFRPVTLSPGTTYRSFMKLNFFGCNFNLDPQGVFTEPMNVFHLRNRININLSGCTFENPTDGRLLAIVDNDTPNNAGSYHSEDTTKLPYALSPTTAFVGGPGHRVAQRVSMEKPSIGASVTSPDPQDNGDFIVPFPSEGSERRIYRAFELMTGKMPGSAGAPAVYRFHLAPNAVIWEWGALTAVNVSGASVGMNFQLQNSAGAAMASLAYNSTTNPSPSATPKIYTPADGEVRLVVTGTTTAEIRGQLYMVVG